MFSIFFVLSLFPAANSLKSWIPNTDVNNKQNWDKEDVPRDCDQIYFASQVEVAAYWNLKKVALTGLSLPESGDIIFPRNVQIVFRNKEKCSQSRDLTYIRREVKGWLDPDNWKSDSEGNWVPHSERVPCAGEPIIFPPERTFAVQLPSILIPIGTITFDNEAFQGDTWSEFLKTELGFQLFKGLDDLRNIPWRNDVGCSDNKSCFCGRSSYSIRDGVYKDTDPRIFEEAVCLYAMPKCKAPECFYPVMPEGHCCGICGAFIKIEDTNEKGLNISDLKAKVWAELAESDHKNKLKTYVGRTKDGNIQIVIVPENSDDTIKSHNLANIIRKKLSEITDDFSPADQKPKARISSHLSGLRFSNYLFNSVSGSVFGTLVMVIFLFISLFYIYLVLPKKKFQSSVNPFMFARFENLVNEENLEIGVEAEAPQELPQAFDNPMYAENTEPPKESSRTRPANSQLKESATSHVLEGSTTKEYNNPVYSELEETKKEDKFLENLKGDEEFSEVTL